MSHIGGPHQPPKGTDDEDVLAHARRTSQVIVTTNHDMIVLCAEQEESVVWLDPRDRDLSRAGLVRLAFGQIHEWDAHLTAAVEPICVVAHKTISKVLSLDHASRLALERGKRRRRESARREKEAGPLGGLVLDDE